MSRSPVRVSEAWKWRRIIPPTKPHEGQCVCVGSVSRVWHACGVWSHSVCWEHVVSYVQHVPCCRVWSVLCVLRVYRELCTVHGVWMCVQRVRPRVARRVSEGDDGSLAPSGPEQPAHRWRFSRLQPLAPGRGLPTCAWWGAGARGRPASVTHRRTHRWSAAQHFAKQA